MAGIAFCYNCVVKRFLVLFISLLFLFVPSVSAQSREWVITSFDDRIFIQKSGVALVEEQISVDFNTTYKHGIYRDIPYVYQSSAGEDTYTDVSIKQVLQDSHNATYSITESGDYKEIKIGDSDRTLAGKHTYTITYEVTGVLRGYKEYDEFYWNVTGNNWDVPIGKATAVVTFPQDILLKSTCYQGVSGSKTPCLFTQRTAKEAYFQTTRQLQASEGFTIVSAYKKGVIPLRTVQSFTQKLFSRQSLLFTLALGILGIVGVILLWYHKGRDLWKPQGAAFDTSAKESAQPVGVHETTVVEYTPPQNLRPAEIGVIMDQRADTLDITATIIDLTCRGYMTIKELPKQWLFGKNDYEMTRTKKSTRDLRGYEKYLLDSLFETGSKVTVSKLRDTFYEKLKKTKEMLYEELVHKKLFVGSPESIRTAYFAGALIFMIATVVLFFISITNASVLGTDIGAGLFPAGILFVVLSRSMSRRTAQGHELYRRIRGYREFVEKAEKYRQRFFEDKNLFNEVLPYAIVFGLTVKFAQAMKDMGIPYAVAGYYGTHPFTTSSFVSSVNDFSGSMSSAIASTPSSSGGFSSGGSSGGGFGGGGGGSW